MGFLNVSVVVCGECDSVQAPLGRRRGNRSFAVCGNVARLAPILPLAVGHLEEPHPVVPVLAFLWAPSAPPCVDSAEHCVGGDCPVVPCLAETCLCRPPFGQVVEAVDRSAGAVGVAHSSVVVVVNHYGRGRGMVRGWCGSAQRGVGDDRSAQRATRRAVCSAKSPPRADALDSWLAVGTICVPVGANGFSSLKCVGLVADGAVVVAEFVG